MKRILIALFVLLPSLAVAQVSPYPGAGITPPIFGNPSAVDGGGTFGPQLFGPVSCTAPAYSFTGDSNTGYGASAADTGCLVAGGTSTAAFTASAFTLTSAATFGWSTDALMAREGAGHIFQRNTTNAQRLSVANTYTSATNYEAFSVDWQTTANVARVGARTAATGTTRAMQLVAQASSGSDSFGMVQLAVTHPVLLADRTSAALGAVNDSATGNWFQFGGAGVNTAVTGPNAWAAILPSYNQASGTAANTDLLINRTQTAVGSGAQLLIDAQVSTASKFSVNNLGGVLVASAGSYGNARAFTVNTAPTVANGCTGESMVWNNGTAAFEADMGTTCAGVSTVVFTLPAMTNAWSCTAINVTTSATAAMEMTASDTTTATFTNFTRTTGIALAFVDGANVRVSCFGG